MYSSPFRHATRKQASFGVRLACFSHAASVQSEPGSNSSIEFVAPDSQARRVSVKWSLPGRPANTRRPGLDEPETVRRQQVGFPVAEFGTPIPVIRRPKASSHTNGKSRNFRFLASQGCSWTSCCDGWPEGSDSGDGCETDAGTAHPRGYSRLFTCQGTAREASRHPGHRTCPSHERGEILRGGERLSRVTVDVFGSICFRQARPARDEGRPPRFQR
jgi:hypothetical protein